jgi:hypothetical protein
MFNETNIMSVANPLADVLLAKYAATMPELAMLNIVQVITASRSLLAL